MKKKIYFFIGTTAELIKLAPVIREFERRKIKFKIITSGQTKVKFEELSFLIKKQKADINLGEKSNKSSLLLFLVWFVKTLLKIGSLNQEFKGLNSNNSYFIVHGDPVSSLIGAIIAKIYGLKLVHVESGLRSFNYLEPFPEEICRVLISKIADIHFAPNQWSVNNLKDVNGVKVNTNQNTSIEGYNAIKKIKKLGKKYFVLVVHRQEHVIFGKEKSSDLIKLILKNIPNNLNCVFITHATTKSFLSSINFKLNEKEKGKVIFAKRMSYPDFINLLYNCEFLITDGGSNQEEAYYMGLPCLVLRNVTERVEGLGENVVLAKENKIKIKDFMKNYKKYKRDKTKISKSPSKIVVDYLISH